MGSSDTLTLEDRIAALEAMIGGAMADTISPNVLQIAANGAIGALFGGGVQMIERTNSTYNPSTGLGWLDSAGSGAIREFILGELFGSFNILNLASQPDATDAAVLQLIARIGGFAGSAKAFVSVNDNSGASAGATLLDSLGRSNFVQLGSINPSMVWFGAVAAGGGVRLNGSGNWTVARTAVGTYTLTLSGGPPGIWAIATIQINEQTFSYTDVNYISQVGGTTTLTVATEIGATFNAASDTNWSFHAFASH